MLRRFWCVVLIGTALFLCLRASQARDVGQWEGSDPALRKWYQSLMQPDNPTISCCGESDAYWADEVVIEGDKVFAVITDTREDAPLGRLHVPPGTKIEIPRHKYTFRYGNPTGHKILFLGSQRQVFCFVDNGGV